MFTALTPRPMSILGRAALMVFALVMGSGAIAQGNPDATMTIASDPSPNTDPPQWATVSRDATGSVGAADYYIAYTVSITNPSNSSKNFKFIADFTVSGGAVLKPPTNLVSSRPDCAFTVNNPFQVTCPKLEVAKGKTITFTLRFRTPTAGASMTMMGNLYFPVSSNTVAVSRSTTIELKEEEAADYRLGFYTYVPTTGGTFCTGDNGNGGETNPGCVAKSVDPITTTIVIASGSISSATTARVQEGPGQTCASGTFTVCYDTTLTIPDATFNPPMGIYLRVDRSRIRFPVTLSAIVVEYDGVEVKECASNPTLPAIGKPCWDKKGIYPADFVPADFRYDFYMYIRARSNGTYRLR
jgi:hypothetical protein